LVEYGAAGITLLDRAKSNDFTGIEFYGTFDPSWLPAAIAEAHKLGLHVHGGGLCVRRDTCPQCRELYQARRMDR
jgi:hypothetical protein